MPALSTELLLIILGSVVVLSYIFSVLSRYIKVPSVLLLLASGIILRFIANAEHWNIALPPQITELLGVTGLIMIVLEAGLDLRLGKEKVSLIRNSFFSALFVLLLSAAGVSLALYYWLHEPLINCVVYAIPLSIMSGSIVIPSIHTLTENKKEFLVYEASFSDIMGILFFNYFVAGEVTSLISIGSFFLNIIIAIVLSLVFSILLLFILTRSKLNIKFFLVFSLLIILYEGGKMMHLPSLIIILVFGLIMNNWQMIKLPRISKFFKTAEVQEATHLLHMVTAESSFLIRTFFFILFGFSMDLSTLADQNVLLTGSAIVLILLVARFLYLKFFLKENIYPEVAFIPRGLITILLFYKIPDNLQLRNFNEGILFFVILVSGFIMMLGMIFYKKKGNEIVEEELLSK
ncbi:MAG TPA: cation:proton antiporter [Panacibacter sp.]|nr:cation:proton antiporter [Panacibacter sp.]HNP45111.1 cation:proton antiporter [Panacibacter sp.]